MKKRTILITAYAIHPKKGSEDGTAWNIVLQLMRYHRIIVVTRENNQPSIEDFFKENQIKGAENVQFLYFDLPYWMRFWKKGGRGALLYFYMWQIGVVSFVRRQKVFFEIVHNLNFHSDWTPSFLWKLKKPFFWGPVGHHPLIPVAYLRAFYGKKEEQLDRLKWQTKRLFWRFDPFLKETCKRAARVIAINSSVKEVLRVSPEKVVVIPAVGSERVNNQLVNKELGQFEVLSVGRFVALKGFDITVRSFAAFANGLTAADRDRIRLTLVGKGEYQPALERLICDLGVSDCVNVIEWVERQQLWEIYRRAHLFFFPSHEGAGMVVPEALSCSTPVLCFDNCGPGEFINDTCGVKIPYTRYEESIEKFATILSNIFKDPEYLAALQAGAWAQYERHFDWEVKGKAIAALYDAVEL